MHRAGFTLIELLVVIALLGIAATVAALSVSGSESRRVNEEAARLAALFRIAQDEVRVSGQAIVWEADTAGYRFHALDPAVEWKDDILRARSWPFEVRRIDALPVVFGREPLLQPATIRIATAEDEVRLVLDAFGTLELTR